MPVRVYWDDDPSFGEKRVLRIDYIGAWTWEELYSTRGWATDEFDRLPHPYSVIVLHNWTQQTHLPLNIFVKGREIILARHPRTGLHILMGVNPTFIALWQVFVRFYMPKSPLRFEFALNMKDARTIIEQEITKSGTP